MQELLVSALRTQRILLRARWEALLRVEPVGTPLGNPDALVHLIDWTLDEIFTSLTNPLARHRTTRGRLAVEEQPLCPCGRNPLLSYFAAGEQALHEALVLAQAATSNLDPLERDASLDELNLVLRHIARREIEAFCGVCQYRHDHGPAHTQSRPEVHAAAGADFTGSTVQPR
jgi:hypothetical protein